MADEVALSLPFTLNPLTGAINSTSSQPVIWSNRVRMAIETAIGERVMRPNYGSKIASAAFSTGTALLGTVQTEISRLFVEQLPLLRFVSVDSDLDTARNVLTLTITYELPNKEVETTVAGVMVVSDNSPFFEELA